MSLDRIGGFDVVREIGALKKSEIILRLAHPQHPRLRIGVEAIDSGINRLTQIRRECGDVVQELFGGLGHGSTAQGLAQFGPERLQHFEEGPGMLGEIDLHELGKEFEGFHRDRQFGQLGAAFGD